jgi:uncharacterized protein
MPEDFDDPEGSENLDEPPPFFPYDGPSRIDSGELKQVQVEGVFAAESGGSISRFVLVTDGPRRLPIMIGPFEAHAISMPLEGSRPERPMTHDLLKSILDRFEATLDRVVIDDLWSTIYYAKLYLRRADDEFEIDARPSDAIAMAVRFDAPIYVADSILETGLE